MNDRDTRNLQRLVEIAEAEVKAKQDEAKSQIIVSMVSIAASGAIIGMCIWGLKYVFEFQATISRIH